MQSTIAPLSQYQTKKPRNIRIRLALLFYVAGRELEQILRLYDNGKVVVGVGVEFGFFIA